MDLIAMILISRFLLARQSMKLGILLGSLKQLPDLVIRLIVCNELPKDVCSIC